MGIRWLRDITALLNDAGIRAAEGFPGGAEMEPESPVATVELRNVDYGTGMAEFGIRVISPRTLGGWACQETAAEVARILENTGITCGLEPMGYLKGSDCFQILVTARWLVLDSVLPAIYVNSVRMGHVTEFSAEQDRQRRTVGSLRSGDPAAITPPRGGWRIRVVQQNVVGEPENPEGEEPFVLTLEEKGRLTVFSGCVWNRVKRQIVSGIARTEWEGYALRKEQVNG